MSEKEPPVDMKAARMTSLQKGYRAKRPKSSGVKTSFARAQDGQVFIAKQRGSLSERCRAASAPASEKEAADVEVDA